MQEDYPFLYYCFSCFPAITEQTEKSHRGHFISCAKYDYVNISGTRVDISFFEDRGESWLEIAAQADTFFYDEAKTEEDIMVMFQLLTWDILFPEKILSSEKLTALKSKVIELLEQGEKTGNHSFHIDDLIWELEEQDWSELSRFDLLYMQREIGLPEIEMEYFVPELWFFKLSFKPTSAT